MYPIPELRVLISALLLLILSNSVSAVDNNWLLHTLKHSVNAAKGDTLTLNHTFGDIRVKTADTDKIQLTAMAQYHKEDARIPEIVVETIPSDNSTNHIFSVRFKDIKINTDASWPQRRIDIGILVPKNIKLNISANNGFIEARNIQSDAELKTVDHEINYAGSGELMATSQNGNITARIENTSAKHTIKISTVTGNIRCILLDGSNTRIHSQTHAFIATDFTTHIERLPHSTLKKSYTKTGTGNTKINLKSQNGSIRLQSLMVPEDGTDS